jgi:uncharacterized protein involved in outer membrane biogenesis
MKHFSQHISLRLVAISVFAVVVLVFVWFFATHSLHNLIENKASGGTGRKISFAEQMDFHWGWPVTGVTMQNVHIANFKQGTAPDMFSADSVFLSVDILSTIKGHLTLPEIKLDNPVILLEKDDKGNANWDFTSNAGGATAAKITKPEDRTDIPEIGHLLIKNGKLTFKDPDPKKPIGVTLAINTVAGSANKDEALHFVGTGNYQKQPFKLDVTGGSILTLKNTSKPYPIDMEMHVGNTLATLKGTMTDPVQFKGMNIELHLKGADASELFTIVGIALPPTPPYDVTGQLSLDGKIWNFKNFKGKLGGSDLGGNVSWDTTAKRPVLTGNFLSNNLDFKDLGGLVGAPPTKDKQVSAKQKQLGAKVAADPRLIPDTPLDISRLSSMDAHVSFTGKKIATTLPLDDFYMRVDLDNNLLQLNPIRFGTASGDIKAYMTINARVDPVKIDGDFHFRRLALKPLFEKLSDSLDKPNLADGYIGGVAKLSGTGKSLRSMLATSNGEIGVGMEGGHLSDLVVRLLGLDVGNALGLYIGKDKPVPVRCIIGDFGVQNGLMGVRHLVIDTSVSNVKGDGTINLKNEDMNLTLTSDSKDKSLVTLNSPIRLTGTLKNPNVNLNYTNIAARGAAAAAVSLIAAPVAIVAFIEPGLGENSPCHALAVDLRQKNRSKTGNESLVPTNK